MVLNYVFLAINNEIYSLMMSTCRVMRASGINSDIPSPIVDLLTTYENIFEELSHLPHAPLRFDHKIPLKEGVKPFNPCPYRFSLV